MNLVKARIPSGYCVGNLSLLEICLATIGVCVFRCVASVTHFFVCKSEILEYLSGIVTESNNGVTGGLLFTCALRRKMNTK